MSAYEARLARLALRDPRKIPSMLRLKLGRRDEWRRDLSGEGAAAVAPPFVVAIRMSYACNLRCVMCNQWGEEGVFVKTPDRLVRREMTTDELKRFIDDIAGFKPFVYFTGGEPLMSPDILEIVRHASSRHLVTSMSTNGTFLKEKTDGLIEAGLDYLYTSLDAPVALAKDAIRVTAKGGDSTQEAAEAIKHLIRRRDELGVGLPIVQTQTIVVRENQHLLLDMARFVQDELGSDLWGLQLCVFTTPELNAATTRSYQASFGQDQVGWAGFIRDFPGMDFERLEEQLRAILNGRWRFKLRAYKPLGMKGFSLRDYYTRPERFATDEPLTCMNPYVFAQLQPNGDVAFCGSQPDYTIGNVKDARFMDLWRGERAARWRRFLQKQLFASCARCFSLHEFDHFRAR
ncbi:MAG: radical SAM protein [Elusimicrobia bacterium]|nr:radical SAM protein [Elusimicrobiota bacterium]